MKSAMIAAALLEGWMIVSGAWADGPVPAQVYPTLRMPAQDQGIVLQYGDGPARCDELGARDVVVWQDGDTYYMNYDGAGPRGWLVCAATSADGIHWNKHGAVIDLGPPGSGDSGSASYGVPYHDGAKWYLYYLGTTNISAAPDKVPTPPYLTFTAESDSPLGPWKKRYDLPPITRGSPGPVLKIDDQYVMVYNMGLARTPDLEKPWVVDPAPLMTPRRDCENVSLYYEPANQTWFLFTDHIKRVVPRGSYTDGAWVYWTKDVQHWNPANCAIVLDGTNCSWSKSVIGLPSVMKVGNRLALYYDGRTDPNDHWHMKRHIGLAWLDLPLQVPQPAP